jgi:hypothetical protein
MRAIQGFTVCLHVSSEYFRRFFRRRALTPGTAGLFHILHIVPCAIPDLSDQRIDMKWKIDHQRRSGHLVNVKVGDGLPGRSRADLHVIGRALTPLDYWRSLSLKTRRFCRLYLRTT